MDLPMLDEQETKKLAELNFNLPSYCGYINNAADAIITAIKDETVLSWMNEIEAGRKCVNVLSDYCERLNTLSKALRNLYQAIESYIDQQIGINDSWNVDW